MATTKSALKCERFNKKKFTFFSFFFFLPDSLRKSSPRVELSKKSNPCIIQLKGKYNSIVLSALSDMAGISQQLVAITVDPKQSLS